MEEKKIQDLVQEYFRFLETDFQMNLIQVQDESWGCRLIYQGAVSAVTVDFERREHYPFVTVHRLVDASIQHVSAIDEDTVLNSFDLDDVVQLAGGTPPEPEGKTVEDMLAVQASHLKTYGAAILKGNFDQFPALEARVKARARLYKGT